MNMGWRHVKVKKLIKMTLIALLTIVLFLTFAISRTQQTFKPLEDIALKNTSSGTIMYVDPSTTNAEVYQKFSINVSIFNVTDLYGWEFKLKWNSALLDALNITEGNFLKSGGDTFFVISINNTEGYLRAACTLIGSIPGVNGSGTLATIWFYVETSGECALDLFDTKLVSSDQQPIAHTTIDGYCYTGVGEDSGSNYSKRPKTL
jgi:hypothetical protein